MTVQALALLRKLLIFRYIFLSLVQTRVMTALQSILLWNLAEIKWNLVQNISASPNHMHRAYSSVAKMLHTDIVYSLDGIQIGPSWKKTTFSIIVQFSFQIHCLFAQLIPNESSVSVCVWSTLNDLFSHF